MGGVSDLAETLVRALPHFGQGGGVIGGRVGGLVSGINGRGYKPCARLYFTSNVHR